MGGTAAFGCIAMTSLTGKMSSAAVKVKPVPEKPTCLVAGRPVGLEKKKLPLGCWCSLSLYQPGKLEGVCRRATEPVCSLQLYRLKHAVPKHGEPVLYYLLDGPTRGFVREEVHVVLLAFTCRRKTVSNSLVASLRSSSVVAIS